MTGNRLLEPALDLAVCRTRSTPAASSSRSPCTYICTARTSPCLCLPRTLHVRLSKLLATAAGAALTGLVLPPLARDQQRSRVHARRRALPFAWLRRITRGQHACKPLGCAPSSSRSEGLLGLRGKNPSQRQKRERLNSRGKLAPARTHQTCSIRSRMPVELPTHRVLDSCISAVALGLHRSSRAITLACLRLIIACPRSWFIFRTN